MSLTPGTRLGLYEILAPIGAGGMGEVYRARDTKLRREVALKILPELFAADPERRARLTREAQVLASLNHTNIAAIYGIEESDADISLALCATLASADELKKGCDGWSNSCRMPTDARMSSWRQWLMSFATR